MKERFACVVGLMFPQRFDRVVGDGHGPVVPGGAFDGRLRLVVEPMLFRGEVAVLIVDAIRVVEAVLERLAVDVPFAGW